MNHSAAHALLNRAKLGEPIPTSQVMEALQATGDLDGWSETMHAEMRKTATQTWPYYVTTTEAQ